MKLYYLIAVDVDRDAILSDAPPEDTAVCLADELRAHLADDGVRGACGVVNAEVLSLPAEIDANARLIVKAPEMRDLIEGFLADFGDDYVGPLFVSARALLAEIDGND